MTYKATPGYVTRTLQGLDKKEGGYAQPVTLREAMKTWNIELYIGVDGQEWTPITEIKIQGNDVYFSTEYTDVWVHVRYTDAVRARVRKDR